MSYNMDYMTQCLKTVERAPSNCFKKFFDDGKII